MNNYGSISSNITVENTNNSLNYEQNIYAKNFQNERMISLKKENMLDMSMNNNESYPKSTNIPEKKNFAQYYLSETNQQQQPKYNSIRYNLPQQFNQRPNQLLNSWKNSAHEQHFQEQYQYHKKDIEDTRERIKSMENKIIPNKTEFYEYNKRNDYAVLKDKPTKKTSLLYYLQNTDGLYNRNVQMDPIQPMYK